MKIEHVALYVNDLEEILYWSILVYRVKEQKDGKQ